MMAVSYWVLLRELEPVWFLSNLTLVIRPLFFMRDLVSDEAAARI